MQSEVADGDPTTSRWCERAAGALQREPRFRSVLFSMPMHHASLAMRVDGRPGLTVRVLLLVDENGGVRPYEALFHYMLFNDTMSHIGRTTW